MATVTRKQFILVFLCILSSTYCFASGSDYSSSISQEVRRHIQDIAEEFENKTVTTLTDQIDKMKQKEVNDLVTQHVTQKYQNISQKMDKLIKTFDMLLKTEENNILNKVNKDIQDLEGNINSSVSDFIETTNNYVENNNQRIKEQVAQITEQTKMNLKREYENILQNISDNNFQSDTHKPIAFTALLSSNTKSSNGSYVIFDRVVSNFGGGYDSTRGIFTATTDGVFLFTSSFLVDDGYVNVQLVKNGNEIARGYAAKDSREGAGFITLIVPMSNGDRVGIKMIPGWTTGCLRGDFYSSFSGFSVTVT